MKRSGLSVLRRNVSRSFFSTHQKATPYESSGSKYGGVGSAPTAFSFEHTTPIVQSDKTKSLLELEEKTLAKVSNETEERMLNTNQLLYASFNIIK